MAELQKTDLAAYERGLQEADEALVKAQSAVATARQALNERRVEEGLEPIDYDTETDEDKSGKTKGKTKGKITGDDTPDEATGFGAPHGGSNS